MKLIKKSEKLLLDKIKKIEESSEQSIHTDTEEILEIIVENKPVINVLESGISNYIPVRDNPIVQSVGNSGWQISDIWRDIRVDSFCD
ncbi:MAG: hypothetical protein QNJ47_18510 [Nostocaceae cyanobacterium]|nr:hypothetical protein [Nostocaceae cyanobacterium]